MELYNNVLYQFETKLVLVAQHNHEEAFMTCQCMVCEVSSLMEAQSAAEYGKHNVN